MVRLTSADLSLLGVDIEEVLENPPTTISMELTLAQSQTPVEEVENWTPVLESNPVHQQWLTERRGLPDIYATLTQSQSKEILIKETPLKEQQIKDPGPERSPEKDSKVPDKSPQKNPTRAPGSRKAPPPPPPKRKPVRRLSSSSTSVSKNKPVSKTKPLYWSITPKQSGTVWSELIPEDNVDGTRLSLLEDLFCKDDASKQKSMETEKRQTNQKKGTALAVSVGRANNISIMMTRFKRFNNKVEDLCKAILTGQDVSLEELVLLSQIGPTEMETRDLKEHNREALSIPEQVLLAMSVVPRLRVKASCRVAIETWESHYSEAVNMLETVKASCRQLRESQRLRHVLASVLSVGNAMNKGTSRGNAGGLKIESLSKLWDTKVSRHANFKESKTKTTLQRACSVPTVISQCLEEKEVQNKINSLLDFVAVLVRDNDQKRGLTPCDDYLLTELESLQEAVTYLEDGIGELLSEVEKGFVLLEREFLDMTGESWISVDCTRPDSVHDLSIKNCEVFLEQQHTFLKSSYDFLIMAGGARTFLKQEVNVSDQYLKSTVQWLGEENSGSPKLHLRQLLEFAQQFDISYKKLNT